MSLLTAQMSISVDGFYAGERFDGDGDWMQSAESVGFFRVTRWVIDAMAWRERLGFAGGEQTTNSDIIMETFEAAGAYVMGRRMADGGEVPWGDEPPFHAPVFVVTHRSRETLVRQGGTSFTYVTDGLESAIGQARAVANGKNVAIAGGGTVLRQAVKAGLIDELELHIVPAVLGTGMRLLDADLDLGPRQAIELTPTRVVHTPEVTHIRYRVHGQKLSCSTTGDGTKYQRSSRHGKRRDSSRDRRLRINETQHPLEPEGQADEVPDADLRQ